MDLIAAKVYRPAMFRSLRNDALYREGRKLIDNDGKEVKDERAFYAVRRGSSYGKELSHTSWLGHEYATLEKLYAAGADVPLLLRKPALSRTQIAFSYAGDLWVVGREGGDARRVGESGERVPGRLARRRCRTSRTRGSARARALVIGHETTKPRKKIIGFGFVLS